MKRRFARAVVWPIDRPTATLIIAGAAALIAILLTFRLHTDTSLEAMFTKSDPSARALGHVLNDFPAADQLLILASLPDSAQPDPQKLSEFGHRFSEAVTKSPELSALTDGVLYQADADSRAFVEHVIAPSAIYYLDDASFAAARRRLTPEQMNAQLAQDRALLATPGPAAQALSQTIAIDPLRLREFIMDRLGSQKLFRTYDNGTDFVSPDGKTLLIRVIGREPPSHLEYARKIVDLSRQTSDSVNGDSLQLEYAGSYAIATTSEQSIRRDMIESVIGSAILLQFLFIIIYRNPFQLFVLAFGPVALGILFGFAGFAIVSPALTPITAVLGAILAGMGIDYSIQYISLYESQRRGGESPIDAARAVATSMSGAILAAWATSVIGFLAIGASHVQALRDFAMLGALGLSGAFVCVVALLPLTLRLTDRRATPPERTRFRLEADRAVASIARRRHIWLALCVIATIGASIVVVRGGRELLPLETDLTVMHPRPNPAIDAQRHLSEKFGISMDSLTVFLSADSPDKLISLAYEVKRRLHDDPAAAAQIKSTFGLADLLPDPSQAAARRAALPSLMADRVVADFKNALADNGFAAKPFEPYESFLRVLLSRETAPGINDLLQYRRVAEAVLPAAALAGKSPATESLMYVFARQDTETDRIARDASIDAARGALADLPGVTVTGLGVAGHDTEQTIRAELPRLSLIALLASAIYLGVHFRSLTDATLAMLPTAFGMLTAIALLRILGEHLNMLNLVAIPLLIGIDVDYGIFLVNAARRRHVFGVTKNELTSRVQTAVHAVTVCALATGLGYISLASTSVPAERSLGIASATGVVTCLAGVLFLLLPILFSLSRRK